MMMSEKIRKAHTVLRGETASNVVYEYEHEYENVLSGKKFPTL